jgi:hypothetical protein
LRKNGWLVFDGFIVTSSWAFAGSPVQQLRSFRIFPSVLIDQSFGITQDVDFGHCQFRPSNGIHLAYSWMPMTSLLLDVRFASAPALACISRS